MNVRDRIGRVLRFEKVDRLPRVEFAPWWDQTIRRWQDDGLQEEVPTHRTGMVRIQECFGLDPLYSCKPLSIGPTFPNMPAGQGPVSTMANYEAVREHLYPEINWDLLLPNWIRERHARGELGIWFTLEGYFWFPRKLFGIERHLLAFYDYPDLMHRINADLLEHHTRILTGITSILEPEFMTFSEDMSYNRGPMLSESMFEEFMAPYYRQLVPLIRARNVIPFVDSDGNIETCIPWFTRCGIAGVLPLERQAGVDVARIRTGHPKLLLIGAFDKMAMTQGNQAMRAEWERLLPVMRQGGFIPSVDHQTPPGVSLVEYREYLRLMWEYTERAA